ncbi:MAG: hypothetical protein NT069_33415, partial [Planctomycetota bacterium]|nr:hypothetical protein [Planctomycetota bacterium]
PAARQAYRFLDKRFYRAKRFAMDLRVFACEHVGLARSYDNAQLKRKLTPALEELESIGFLVPQPASNRFVRRSHGEWEIVLYRQEQGTTVAVTDESTPPLVVELMERGVRTTIAADLVRDFPAERITEKIELHDWLVERNDKRISKNSSGYLAAAIREDYRLPTGFVSKAEHGKRVAAEAKVKKEALAQRQESEQQSASRRAALAYWESLPEKERTALEAEAIAAGSTELVDKYRKFGTTVFAEMLLKEIVVGYLRNTDLLKRSPPK